MWFLLLNNNYLIARFVATYNDSDFQKKITVY